MKTKWVPLLMCLILVAWISKLLAQSSNFKLEVKENKGDCIGVAPMKCYLVKYYNSKDWENFYAPLEGFNYEEGYRYKLLVKKTKLKNVPADASSNRYEVVKILSKKRINTTSEESNNIKMTIKENRVDCTGVGKMRCFLVKYKDSKEWEYFYSSFKNFDYKEGYRYEVLVKRTKLKNVPADASSYEYEVKKILSQKRINSNDALTFLEKHSWKLLSLYGKMQSTAGAFMDFDLSTNSVSGNASCNSYFGTVKFEQNKILFSGLGSTQKACLHDNIEREFLDLLSLKGLTYDIAEQTFNIYHADKLVAIFGMTEKKR